jgi:hypothetical protein
MRKIGHIICMICLSFSCEDVIEVDLPTEDPRLIIEALMRVDITGEFIPIEVKVSTTNNFFEEIPITSLESIIIIYEEYEDEIIINTGFSSLTEKEPGTGIYFPNPNFSTEQRIRTSVLDRNLLFNLIIEHEGRKYIAQTKYVPSTPINNLLIGPGRSSNNDETELIIGFKDNAEEDNFYVFDFDFDEYIVSDDSFYQGQQFEFSYFYDQIFEPGTALNVSILGADKTFYNYMDQLIEQTDDSQGPFQTPKGTVRGNVFDITELDNRDVFDNTGEPNVFPLGYFAIVQEYKGEIVIQ